MTEKDEFDTSLELDDNAPDAFDDAGFDDVDLEAEEAPVKAKKSGGGFFVKFLLLLVLLGGGLFASVKYLGVQLPFDVPFLSELAADSKAPPQPVAANTDPAATDTQPTTVVDTTDWGTTDTAVPAENNVMVGGEAPVFGDDIPVADTGLVDPADTGFGFPVTQDTAATDNTDVATWPGVDDTAGVTATDTVTSPADAEMAPAMTDDTTMDDPFGVAEQNTETATTDPVTFDDVAVEQAPVTVATTTPESTVSAEEVEALEQKIADLEKTVQQLKTSTVSKDDVDGLKAALAKFEKPKKDPVPVTETPKKASTAKADESAPVKAAAKKPVVRKTWVLRSAKPGMAWISEKNSSEMKTVSVGDMVSGIGKVTAIAMDDAGRWVVNGTKGKINQ